VIANMTSRVGRGPFAESPSDAPGGSPSRFGRWRERIPFLRRRRTRGQALAEFALVLPVMLLLTLLALDFGRVYLGYINLQNMARVAADFAANNAEAWLTPLTLQHQATITQYQNQALNDAKATNCKLNPAVPVDPSFTDLNSDGDSHGIGDRVTVAFTCTFDVITPIISNIVGSHLSVSASAVFPVKSGQFATSGSGTGPTANFTGTPTSVNVGSNVQFTDSSTGSPTTWSWTFGDGGTSSSQNPLHPYSAAGSYTVALTVTNASGSNTLTRTNYISVSSPAPVANFTANITSGPKPLTVTFTDTSTGSPTAWAWTFGDGGTASTGPVVSHVYNTVGTFSVSLTVTSSSGSNSVTKTNYIVVSASTCTVPNFINTSSSNAQGTWAAAGFSTQVQFKEGNLPWTIQSQDVVASSTVSCATTITLSKH
jgi:PKD repeat protein